MIIFAIEAAAFYEFSEVEFHLFEFENALTLILITPLLLLINFTIASIILLLGSGKLNPKLFFHPATLISTCFGVGKIPFAPGTWGSIFAAILIFHVANMPRYFFSFTAEHMIAFFIAANIVIYFIGVKTTDIYMKKTGKHDPSEVVIDEVSGIFVSVLTFAALFAIPYNLDSQTFKPLLPFAIIYLFLLFILFRIFDIWKPWIVGKFDRKNTAHGVMLDDVFAGIFAGITCFAILMTMFYSGALQNLIAIFLPEWIGQHE